MPFEAISPSQCRAARAMLDWSRDRLAARSEVSASALRNFERGGRVPTGSKLTSVRAALEAAGVAFSDQTGDSPGVRLRRPAVDAPPGA